MESVGAEEPARANCPGCGGAEIRTVQETCADPASVHDGLSDRLASGPGVASRGDSWLHFVEGALMTGVCAGLAYSGVQDDKPLYTIGGSLLAVLLLIGTVVVIRGEARERRVVAAGRARAEELSRSASYCSGCASVFYADGTPWQGVLTPEQYQKYVWTEAGYGTRLDVRAKDVTLPPGIPVRQGGAPDHA
ncbi:hypothetical protein E0500_021000 [Streptomyces sp. KM273126]|uniref:hypothetical protein n=1 Tax=Streptomyces sp. KM273126 TaxID=2545247 RepID=UPI00103E0E22|nr:hypothetical protein [Streptomyces sp. KM273126]MBA2809810.1 hypothetical protein [Streptomyces sp. KM273126]